MNFFEHQDSARKSTRRLVILFVLALVSLIALTNITLIAGLWFFDSSIVKTHENVVFQTGELPFSWENVLQYFDLERVAMVSAVVVITVGIVIFMKRTELSGGGQVIAKRLGGKLISPDTTEARERVILNVVEEMAIASGTAVPPVYLLPESGINAFAAGFNPNDAVIGISEGAINNLNRDQLQGVVAHEFSHIFNGDMRLNINLIAVLSGILFIGHTGWFIVRMFGGSYRRRRSSRDSGSAIALVGLVLVLLGFIGTFFGNLIKSAVSRQREFLADASAVQFTRNPEGIAGALKLIGGSRYGSAMHAAHTEEMSHMFFGNALKQSFTSRWNSMFATHPQLEERIRRIEPNWDGMYLKMANEDAPETSVHGSANGNDRIEKLSSVLGGVAVINSLEQSVEHIGEPDPESQEKARQSLVEIGDQLRESAHHLEGAKAVVYLLLLDKEKTSRIRQQNYLNANEDDACKQAMLDLYESIKALPKHERLDLIELCVPALKTQSKTAYDAFLAHVVFLVKSDNSVELFEWLLHSLLVHYLKPHFYKIKPKPPKYRSLKKLRNECKFLLSYLSYFSQSDSGSDFQTIFAKGFESLELGSTSIAPKEQLSLSDLNQALLHFSHLFPLVKPRLLKACALCIQADGKLTLDEFELLRVLSALLDCPMPLLDLGLEDD